VQILGLKKGSLFSKQIIEYTPTRVCLIFDFQQPLAAIDDIPDNPLQTAVLNLFVSLKYRFPNLVVGMITRDSVKKALMNGITADQVRVVRLVVKQTLKVPLEDHQLPGHTCASADAEECKHSDVSLSSL